MTLQIDQAGSTAQTAATAVKVVELSRGGQPGWSVSSPLSLAGNFVSTHPVLTVFLALGIVAFVAWFAIRKYGATGVAGVLLLARLGLRGQLCSIRRIVRQSRQENISLAAAALADG